MADTITEIQNDFIDGVYEVYSEMFNDGINTGVYFYPYEDNPDKGIYKEDTNKTFKSPILLVARIVLAVDSDGETVEEIKNTASVTIPFKSLRDNSLDTSTAGLKELNKGYLRFNDTFYEVLTIKPQSFVANVFLTYLFECAEDVEMNRNGIEVIDEVE